MSCSSNRLFVLFLKTMYSFSLKEYIDCKEQNIHWEQGLSSIG